MTDLSTALYDETDIARLVESMRRDYEPHMMRLRVRRLLVDAIKDAYQDGSGTGTNVPQPFNDSNLILKTMLGDVGREVMRYVSRVAANDPVVSVIGLVVGKKELSKTVDSTASEQERLHQALWESVKGRSKHRQVAWSQAWGRVGYYLTLPSPTWAMPEREYYEDLSDAEIEAMKRSGKATPEPIEAPDGVWKYAESGSSWMDRRRAAAEGNALNGASLNTLEALPPDVVYKREDSEGIKYLAVIQEIPIEDVQPGGTYSKSYADMLGLDGPEVAKLGILADRDGKIIAGPTQGTEPSTSQSSYQLVRFFTRDEVYYLVSSGGMYSKGKLVWYEQHGDGCVPVIPVPFMRTDSMRPGSEYASPLDPMMVLEPLVNQIVTFLSNVASYNANPRWVIENADGELIPDPETGDPVVSKEPTPGLDPKDATVVRGKMRQLVVDADLLMKLLPFYAERLDLYKLPDVMGGNAGTSGPAWNTQMQIHAAQQDIQPAIDNNCEAVQQLHRIWIRRMRKLDEKIVMLSVPRHRATDRDTRGLIEFDPKDLVEAITVNQSAHTSTDRVALWAAGSEALRNNEIDDLKFYEDFALEEDAPAAIVRKYAHILVAYGMLGDTSVVQPGSLLAGWWEGMKGRLTLALLDRSFSYALSMAEQMTTASNQQALAAENPTAGAGTSIANTLGVRSPGQGMPLQPTGAPGGGQLTSPIPATGTAA